jgi:hypothetical protein
MSSVAPSTDLPPFAQVELAEMTDGLGRWIRLRLLRERAESAFGSGELSALDDALAAALPAAQKHADHLAAFYEKNGDAINALIAGTMDADSARLTGSAPQKAIAKLGDDPAAALAARAADFSTHSDPRCNAILNKMLECYCACMGGVESACGSIWGEIYEQICL